MARLTRSAAKELDSLPLAVQAKADALIARLDSEPALGKKLKGQLDGLRSVHLVRTHRIIYKLDTSGPIVIAVVPRKDAYRR